MTLVFLHVDKTGGMSVRNYLAQYFDTADIRPVPHHSKIAIQCDYPVAHPNLIYHNRLFRDEGHQLVMGHYDWSIVDKLKDPIVTVVLRNPYHRVLSLYKFISKHTSVYGELSDQCNENGLRWFAESCTKIYRDTMTAQLAGVRWATSQPVDSSVFMKAAENLSRCDVIGFTDDLGRFCDEVRVKMRWPERGCVEHINSGNDDACIDNDTRQIVSENTYYDQCLMQLAREYNGRQKMEQSPIR